jgi:PilZ domain-containing protein
MANRHERRIPLAVPVRIRHVDAKGNHAVHAACTLNVSRYGVRLDGAKFLRMAKTVTLLFRNSRAEYRVVWVGDEDSPLRGQVGLRALDHSKNYMWEIPIPSQEHDSYEAAPPSSSRPSAEGGGTKDYDRRRAPRFDCDRGVQAWREGNTVPVWGSLRDLSFTGCKVNTTTPLPVGTRVRVLMNLFGTRVRASGDVCAADKNTFGIQFTRMSLPEEAKLQAVLSRLANGRESAPAGLVEAADILTRLTQWFRQMEFLTREQYLDIINGGTGDILHLLAAMEAAAPTKAGPRTQ